MSHFTVMVIGDDHEEQLAPFHEYECTGTNDQYVQDIDITDEVKHDYRQYLIGLKGDGDAAPCLSMRDWLIEHECVNAEDILGPEDTPETEGDDATHRWGYHQFDSDGQLLTAVRRTNPNAKWDWYQVGGRWQGMLKLKPEYAEAMGHLAAFKQRGKSIPDSLLEQCAGIAMGRASLLMDDHKYNRFYVDQAPKGKIDFDGMVNEHLAKVVPVYDTVIAAIAGRDWQTWDEVREAFKPDFDRAREYFHAQPVVEDIKAVLKDAWMVPWNDYKKDRDTFIADQSVQALTTFAMVKDGQWLQQGEMGWFGHSNDAMSESEWGATVLSTLEALDDDTLITIVDCHI